MSLRTRLLLIFGGIVVLTVTLVSYTVASVARHAFQRIYEQRTSAAIKQFEREFEMRGQGLARQTAATARAEPMRSMALALSGPAADSAAYLNLASSLASEQQLDYLDILTPDGVIISSAEWPARFGVREPWVNEVSDWNSQTPFLQYQETPRGKELALVCVRELSAGDHSFHILAGRRIDSNFLDTLVLPEGTQVLLWRPSSSATGELEDAHGSRKTTAELKTLLEQTHNTKSELTARIYLDDSRHDAAITHTIPLLDRPAMKPLAVLVVASSRRELVDLQNQIRNVGILAAVAGIVLSVIASGWWAARLSRPIEELSSAAQDVAEGNWERKVYGNSLGLGEEVSRLIASFNQMTEELVRQRDRALQAERVAAWRELARRLAHELKNPLFPLQITIENLIKARQQNSPEFSEIFAESTTTLLAELRNLNKIIGRFSDFSKMPPPELKPVNVNQILEEIAKLFAPQLASAAKPIKLETRFAVSDTDIPADPDLLRRAFENLVLNAIDAMPDGGILRIATSISPEVLTVEIADSGVGLTEAEASRLFTPYYTTKQHGTGLGLAIVQSVISDHQGRVSVSSRPGEGTTFRIEFRRQLRKQASDAFAGRV